VGVAPRHSAWLSRLVLGLGLLAAFGGFLFLGSTGIRDAVMDGAPNASSSEAGLAHPVGAGPVDAPAGWELAWHDEFERAPCPPPWRWSYEHGFVRNEEDQWYQPANAFCERGALVLEARRVEVTNPFYVPGSRDWRLNREQATYTSASILSKRSFTYGRFEVRARIDPRAGSWPTFWTLGSERDWPQGGEVDVMEYYTGMVRANVCKPLRRRCRWSIARRSPDRLGKGWAERFHVAAMEWNSRWIDLFLDGERVNRFAVADAVRPGQPNPYVDTPQNLMLSQAIGGENGGDPEGTEFPVRFEVDYVRVFRRAPHARGRDRAPS
jgi:beta-glucanase (GH16 family)